MALVVALERYIRELPNSSEARQLIDEIVGAVSEKADILKAIQCAEPLLTSTDAIKRAHGTLF